MISNKELSLIVDRLIAICYNESHHQGQSIQEYASSIRNTLKEIKKKGK